MAASPGGGIGAAYFLIKPVIRTLVHQARATAASTTNSAKSTILHNQLKQLPRSSHYVKHTSFNLRKQVQRLVRSAWKGIARPIPTGQASRTVAYPSSTTQATSRIAIGHDASFLAKYTDIIRSAFNRTSPTFPRGAALSSHLGIRPSPSRAFAYARNPIGGSSFGAGAAGRARAHQASIKMGGGSGRNYSSGAKVLREISNVPIGMRALADRLREGDEKVAARKVGRVGGKPYAKKENVLVARGRCRSAAMGSSKGSSVTQKSMAKEESLEAYFPVVCGSSNLLSGIPTDLSKDTYLLIPLCPALGEILSHPDTFSTSPTRLQTDPGPSAPFLPSQPTSIPLLPNLLTELFHIHTSFLAHTDHRVIPLLTRLDGYGALGPHVKAGDGRAEVEVILGPGQMPEALRMRFEGVGEDAVRGMIGGGTSGTGKEWYHVYSVPRRGNVKDQVLAGDCGVLETSTVALETVMGGTAALALTPEENAWRMPTLTAAGSMGGLHNVLNPDLSASAWEQAADLASPDISDSSNSTPSTTSSGSISPALLDSPTSSTFDFDFDNFSVELDERITREANGLSIPSTSADLDDSDFPEWTDAELEFEDEDDSVMGSGSFVGSDVEMELGEEEQRVWAA